jgi:predicted enzyme related to lactoylglutathione lyase
MSNRPSPRVPNGVRRADSVAAAGAVAAVASWGMPIALIEFPADDPDRARRFWSELLGVDLEPRRAGQGEGWQSQTGAPAIGIHARGRGPGDSFSLPYFPVADMGAALERVPTLGGTIVHPGDTWAICKDSEGSPFALTRADA